MKSWKEAEDELFRGDSVEFPEPPVPGADSSLVRHILQIDGPGQESPYLSTTESEDTASYFALPNGFILATSVALVQSAELGWVGQKELLQLLVGGGKGKAKWHSAAEVKRAALLVEQHAEHLVDFRTRAADESQLRQTVQRVFTLRGRT